jgi:hypothetical protein
MREVTQAEAASWTALAEEHGFTDESGDLEPGRFAVESFEGDTLTLRTITPIVAGLYTEDLRRKTPPIMFDRTAGGEIVLPGRWWAHMLERLSDGLEDAGDLRAAAGARQLAREASFLDVALPADTDTIAFLAPVDDELVVHEALPPNGVIRVRIRLRSRRRNR